MEKKKENLSLTYTERTIQMDDLKEPITRKERYLAAIAGIATDVPDEPITREERYLVAILKKGGTPTPSGEVKTYGEATCQMVSGKGIVAAEIGVASTKEPTVVSLNRLGSQPGVLYPWKLTKGDSITLSCQDTSHPTFTVQFFSENYSQVDYWTLSAEQTSRTLTVAYDSEFVGTSEDYSAYQLMVEAGEVAHDYDEYKEKSDE